MRNTKRRRELEKLNLKAEASTRSGDSCYWRGVACPNNVSHILLVFMLKLLPRERFAIFRSTSLAHTHPPTHIYVIYRSDCSSLFLTLFFHMFSFLFFFVSSYCRSYHICCCCLNSSCVLLQQLPHFAIARAVAFSLSVQDLTQLLLLSENEAKLFRNFGGIEAEKCFRVIWLAAPEQPQQQ